jgi:hypothetical protein
MAMLKQAMRVALFDAESHCYMVLVALMGLSRTVNLVTVRVAESHSHPFRHLRPNWCVFPKHRMIMCAHVFLIVFSSFSPGLIISSSRSISFCRLVRHHRDSPPIRPPGPNRQYFLPNIPSSSPILSSPIQPVSAAATASPHPHIALREAIATVDRLLATADCLTREARELQGKLNHRCVNPISINSITEQLPRILDHFNEEAAADRKSLVLLFCLHSLFMNLAFRRRLGPCSCPHARSS